VRALDESTWPAFAALVERNNGIFGGCWCMGFHEDARGREPPKRERKLARVRAGTAHAALVFDGDNCLGWCQFGPPDEVPRIKNRAEYEKGLKDLPDWRIACNYVGKGHRRQGVATAALAGALDLIAELGGGRVEGYPEPAGSVPAGFLYHGALSTFEELGFVRDRSASTGGSFRRSSGRARRPRRSRDIPARSRTRVLPSLQSSRTNPSSFPSGSRTVNFRVPYGVSKSGSITSTRSRRASHQASTSRTLKL